MRQKVKNKIKKNLTLKEKPSFQGAEEFSLRNLGRSMHFFRDQGSTDPTGGGGGGGGLKF